MIGGTLAPLVDRDGVLLPDHDGAPPVARLVEREGGDAKSLIAVLTRHGVPCAAADRVIAVTAPQISASDAWRQAVAADRAHGQRLARALELIEEALDPLADAVALASSSFGPLWWGDIDLLVRGDRLSEVEDALRRSGCLSLAWVLERLGSKGEVRYAVLDDGDVLASVELSVRFPAPGPAAGEVVARARRPAAGGLPRIVAGDQLRRQRAKIAAGRRASVRGMLELAALRPEVADSAALVSHRAWLVARARSLRRRIDRRLRGRRVVVAFSGIDGSGKSTQAGRLVEALDAAGIRTAVVWGRIGFSGSPLLSAVSRAGQRMLPAGSHSAQRARATGAEGAAPLTRRGPLGWAWTLAVTLDYLRLVRAGVRRARGRVVVLDRALPDALVDLEQAFGGKLELGLHRKLVYRLAPRPDVIFYLRISGEAAYERKRDLFTAAVLEAYARQFDRLAPKLGAVVIDATRPADELALGVLRVVVEGRSATDR